MSAAAPHAVPDLPRVDGHAVRQGRTGRWIYAPLVLLDSRNRVVRELHWQPLERYLAGKRASR